MRIVAKLSGHLVASQKLRRGRQRALISLAVCEPNTIVDAAVFDDLVHVLQLSMSHRVVKLASREKKEETTSFISVWYVNVRVEKRRPRTWPRNREYASASWRSLSASSMREDAGTDVLSATGAVVSFWPSFIVNIASLSR